MFLLDFIRTFLLRTLLTALISLRALRRNKMRSILTALGIIIGVASVVAMVAVGNGAQARITKQVSALGQNLLTVFAGSRKAGGVNSGLGSASALTLADSDAPKPAPLPRPLPTDATGRPPSSANRPTI
jgi:putative ABC transport system permease protein